MTPNTSPPKRRHSSPPPVYLVHAGGVTVTAAAEYATPFVRPPSRVMARYMRACTRLNLVGWDETAAAWVVEDENGAREHRTEDEAREYLAAVAEHTRRMIQLARMRRLAQLPRGREACTVAGTLRLSARTHRATRQGRVTTRRRTAAHAASTASSGGRDDAGGEPPPPSRLALADLYRFERTAPAGGAA